MSCKRCVFFLFILRVDASAAPQRSQAQTNHIFGSISESCEAPSESCLNVGGDGSLGVARASLLETRRKRHSEKCSNTPENKHTSTQLLQRRSKVTPKTRPFLLDTEQFFDALQYVLPAEPIDEMEHSVLSIWRSLQQGKEAPSIDSLMTIAGSGGFTHLLMAAPIKKILAFDMNPASLKHARLLRAIVRCSESREEFVQHIFGAEVRRWVESVESGKAAPSLELEKLTEPRRLDLVHNVLDCFSDEERDDIDSILIDISKNSSLAAGRNDSIVGRSIPTLVMPVSQNGTKLDSGVGLRKVLGGKIPLEYGGGNVVYSSVHWGRSWMRSASSYDLFRTRFLDAELISEQLEVEQAGLLCNHVKHRALRVILFTSNVFTNHHNHSGFPSWPALIDSIQANCRPETLFAVSTFATDRSKLVELVHMRPGSNAQHNTSVSNWDSSGLLLSNLGPQDRLSTALRAYACRRARAANQLKLLLDMTQLQRGIYAECSLHESADVLNKSRSLFPLSCDSAKDGGSGLSSTDIVQLRSTRQCLNNYEVSASSSVASALGVCPGGRHWKQPSNPEIWFYHRCAQHMSGHGLNIEVYSGSSHVDQHRKFERLSSSYGCPPHSIKSITEFVTENRTIENGTVLLHMLLGEEHPGAGQDCSPAGRAQRMSHLSHAILHARRMWASRIVVAEFNKNSGVFNTHECVPSLEDLRRSVTHDVETNGTSTIDLGVAAMASYRMKAEEYSCGQLESGRYGASNFSQRRNVFFVAERAA